jgi:hypothetical protein
VIGRQPTGRHHAMPASKSTFFRPLTVG